MGWQGETGVVGAVGMVGVVVVGMGTAAPYPIFANVRKNLFEQQPTAPAHSTQLPANCFRVCSQVRGICLRIAIIQTAHVHTATSELSFELGHYCMELAMYLFTRFLIALLHTFASKTSSRILGTLQ